MDLFTLSISASALAPPGLMLITALICLNQTISEKLLWKAFALFSGIALLSTAICPLLQIIVPSLAEPALLLPGLKINPLQSWMAILVQLLGTVIGVFSSRYLQGERGQARYIAAFSGVLASVHMLLLADNWLVLISAWALIGVILERLLCFYSERPFALLAAHKKKIADRVADVLLICAGILAWLEVGSGSLSDLWTYVGSNGMSTNLQLSAVCLVLAVILRVALLPVHGWLIQVMEAPTPVSALLHAGVVNLGGYVLIRFAPLLEKAMPACTLLVAFGLGTAVLAGLVMLTRISIKVRLAWSTTAQMGFMVLECGLGLYTLAALHLIGHSLYKAHTFLSASMVVRETRLQAMRGKVSPIPISLLLAPALAVMTVMLIQSMLINVAWPWWWSAMLGLAWAPLLWLPAQRGSIRQICLHALSGLLMLAGLTVTASLAHLLPFGIHDAPTSALGFVALTGMAVLYLCLVTLQFRPQVLHAWRRWSYAGFYLDEVFTRLALRFWPTRWTFDAFKTTSSTKSY